MKEQLHLFLLSLFIFPSVSFAQGGLTLSNDKVKLSWTENEGKWIIESLEGKVNGQYSSFGTDLGEYSVLFDEIKPSTEPVAIVENGDTLDFPDDTYKLVKPDFLKATTAVTMNRAGEYHKFYPSKGYSDNGAVVFESNGSWGHYKAEWSLDGKYATDILLRITLKAGKDGYYSLPTPTLSYISEKDLQWGIVPGFFQGNAIQESFPLAYAYAQGLPKYPVLCRENTITTMASILSNKNGLTLAVIPEPGQDRNPFEKDEVTHRKDWKIALSHMNSDSQLTPVAYHPVLGEQGSFLHKGETVEFKVRFSLQAADWYGVYKHAVYDIYDLPYSFTLKENKRSLSERLLMQYDYVLDDKTAFWNEEEYKGRTIMAQSYMSDIAGADNDAMKNSDIGAVWMLAKITGDGLFNEKRIPGIRNFKILQQTRKGFFKGAVEGQYYLAKSKRYTEEWGTHFEPVAITFYTMADLANILLFEPENKEIKKLLRNGAEKLLKWQRKDGSWVVAYDRMTHEPLFTDLKDYRPTFYGLIIAYKVLGDKKYLKAAEKGAQWLIENSVKNGHFVGVCGDVRFVNDFSTIELSSAMLDLYEITRNKSYLDAAVEVGKMYTTSVYTHPIPSKEIKKLKGKDVEDWQLSQVGLSFEHGGSMGSAVPAGPILLSCHCPYFLRLYSVTGDEIFRDMARLAAHGRDAFVNNETGVASYYWVSFDKGASPFPHHAWWQIGWIYDYLLAEAELRSKGEVDFPRGFMTAKSGPHKAVGFTAGRVMGVEAELVLRKGLVGIDNPNIDYITAQSPDGKSLFVIFLNSQSKGNKADYKIQLSSLWGDSSKVVEGRLEIEEFGYKIIRLEK